MSFLAPIVPDCIRQPLNLAAAYTHLDPKATEETVDAVREDLKETIMSVVRVFTAYVFFRLSEKALGAATFAAMKDNRLMTAGLFVGECLISVPAMLIHVGGIAIRNNLPELFKAWTERNVSNHAVGLLCLAAGVVLLTSYVRSWNQTEETSLHKIQTFDYGIADKFLSRRAYMYAYKKFPLN